MKTFTRDYRITGSYDSRFEEYMHGSKPCILDIEATGLDPSKCRVCLVALLVRTENGVRITQFLAENHYEEHLVLEATADFLERENIGYLITYNGRAYDIPFINRRLELNYSDRYIDLFDFDLYRYLSKGTDLRKRAGSLRQMAVEDHYGIFSDRRDTITGRESVTLFNEYALTGSSTIEKVILTHNREDVLQLHRLMFLALDEAADFDAAMAQHGFPSSDGRLVLRPYISRQNKALRICGEQLRSPVSAAFFADTGSPLTAVFNRSSSSFEITAPLEVLNDNYYIDASALGLDIDDDNCINGYLILSPRTVNLISSMITDIILAKLDDTGLI